MVSQTRLDTYMTVGDAARVLGVSIATLRNWDRSGKVTALRHPVNGYRLYRSEDLEHLLGRLNANRVSSAQDPGHRR